MSNSPVGVRVATAEDLRFVASTWFHSVLKSGARINEMPYGIYKLGMEAHIQQLLEQSTARVAFATAQPDEILGYAVLSGDTFHQVYVKSMYRRQGVGRSLIGDSKTYTHPATPGAGKKFAVALGLTYNPRLT